MNWQDSAIPLEKNRDRLFPKAFLLTNCGGGNQASRDGAAKAKVSAKAKTNIILIHLLNTIIQETLGLITTINVERATR